MEAIKPQDQYVDTDKGRLFVRRWTPAATTVATAASAKAAAGKAPIVLFHDSLGSVELWRDLPGRLALATGREVIAYDRLGFGRSDPSPDRLPARSFIPDEASTGFRWLHQGLGLDGFVVFGHSVGGAMGVVCAARYPDCRALVSESAQTFGEDRTLEGIRAARENFRDPAQVARLAKYHGDKAQWVLDAWIDNWLDPVFQEWRLEPVLPEVTCPVLAIHGDSDEYGTTIHAKRIAGDSAGPGTLVLIENCGHVPHREQPDFILQTVADWLADKG